MKKRIIIIIGIILLILVGIFAIHKYKEDSKISIPKVYFEGDISNMINKEDERDILIKYTSSEVNFVSNAKIKIQGSSSLDYEKKNYTINLYEDDSYNDKYKVDVGQGWGAQSKYCLKANWIDKTHSRNIVSARIAGIVQSKYNVLNDLPNHGSIDGFPVEIYINNEFLGLYTWNMPKDEWIWNMDKNNQNHIVLGGKDWSDQVLFKKEVTDFEEDGWDIEIGTPNQETIENFNKIIRFINDSSDEEFVRDFDKYLNKDATLNYLVMLYLLEATDNTGRNLMLATYDNGQTWYPCLYDLDTTFGTWWDGLRLQDSYETTPKDAESKLFLRMIECFADEISTRYFELRKDIFTKESILREFNVFFGSIPEKTYKKEAKRWKDIPGYGIDQIEEFLDFRIPFLDNLMGNLNK